MISKTVKKIIRSNAPRWIILLIDINIVVDTFLLAYLIRFNFKFDFDTVQLFTQVPIIIFCALLAFLITGSYKGTVRHTGLTDLVYLFFSSIILSVLLILAVGINKKFGILNDHTIPLSIIIIHFMLNIFFLNASRFAFKLIYFQLFTNIKIEKKALIYGAGETGLLAYSVLNDIQEKKYSIVGFVDDNKRKWGKKINGVRVYKLDDISEEFVKKKGIDEVIIAFQNRSSVRLMEITEKLSSMSLEVKIVPHAQEWIDFNLNSKQIKKVKIEDLLGRIPININNPTLKKELAGKVVLITGAAGSIGSEIARQVIRFDCKHLILIDQAESALYEIEQELLQGNSINFSVIVANTTDQHRMSKLFELYKPNLVFHAAAYKHVPLMEKEPYESVNINVKGTLVMTKVAIEHNVEKFVMISTDKAVNPTNVMGATKRLAEMLVSAHKGVSKTKFITTRFGNVLGSNGSVIPLFKKQIENGGPITVTHKEINRYFMTIPEACQLVLEAGSMGSGGEIYVFDMGDSVKIFDLALNMINLSGLRYKEDIDIKITGLRPGEKIHEELLADGENTIKTYNPKIMIAKVKELNSQEVIDQVNNLLENLSSFTNDEIVRSLKKIVPKYISKNSIYEAIDAELAK